MNKKIKKYIGNYLYSPYDKTIYLITGQSSSILYSGAMSFCIEGVGFNPVSFIGSFENVCSKIDEIDTLYSIHQKKIELEVKAWQKQTKVQTEILLKQEEEAVSLRESSEDFI